MTNLFLAVFTMTLANGQHIEAEGQKYGTYGECMLEQEAQVKLMGLDIERAEQEGDAPIIIVNVRGECRPVYGKRGRIGKQH